MSTTTLMIRSQRGRYIPATREDICSAYAALMVRDLPKEPFESPAAVKHKLTTAYQHFDYEVFGMLALDNRHRLLSTEELFRGTIDGASVHPREVVKTALARSAAAVVFFHNHPSGLAEPSAADEMITLRLKDALALVDIRVLDHLIIGRGKCVSLAERGAL